MNDIKKVAWQMVVFILGIAIAWGSLNSRVDAVERKVESYPSIDYFELKFEVLEKNIEELKLELTEMQR